MRLASLIFVLMISVNTFAHEAARQIVLQELTTYSNDYGISHIELGEYLGVVNKKYSFQLKYQKNFCNALACAKRQCMTVVGLDSDAVIDFEAEQDSGRCEEL